MTEPPAAVLIPVQEGPHPSSFPSWSFEPFEESVCHGLFLWVGEPSTTPGEGRLLVVPFVDEGWLSRRLAFFEFSLAMPPFDWDRGHLYVASSEIVEARGVAYWRFVQDPQPVDARACHDASMGRKPPEPE